jgi:hypothetical protein
MHHVWKGRGEPNGLSAKHALKPLQQAVIVVKRDLNSEKSDESRDRLCESLDLAHTAISSLERQLVDLPEFIDYRRDFGLKDKKHESSHQILEVKGFFAESSIPTKRMVVATRS